MADRSTISIDLAERIAAAGEVTVDEVRHLRREVEQIRSAVALLEAAGAARHLAILLAVGPALESYARHLATLERARNDAIAQRVEARSDFALLMTSKSAFLIYGVCVAALAGWLGGLHVH